MQTNSSKTQLDNLTKTLAALSAIMIIASLYAVFIYVPTEKSMGIVQRIFYFHVPSAWIAFLAFFVTFISGILYLAKRDLKWDRLAYSSAEVGVIFATLVLFTGPLWGKPIWGTWWTWDARLTTFLILWLLYVGYLMLRSYVQDPDQRARFAAVLGIIGFADVPLVYMSIVWWRTLHPAPVISIDGIKMAPSMFLTLMVSLVAFSLLYVYILRLRLRLEEMKERVERLQIQSTSEEEEDTFVRV